MIAGADDGIRVIALGLAGRRDEARVRLAAMRESSRDPALRRLDGLHRRLARRQRPQHDGEIERAGLGVLKIQDDPEAIFQEGWLFCDVGEHARGLADLSARWPRATSSRRR